jgi:hypothetical protein
VYPFTPRSDPLLPDQVFLWQYGGVSLFSGDATTQLISAINPTQWALPSTPATVSPSMGVSGSVASDGLSSQFVLLEPAGACDLADWTQFFIVDRVMHLLILRYFCDVTLIVPWLVLHRDRIQFVA